jgi:hypothetical protein
MSEERELLKAFIDFVDSYEFYPTERNIIWEIVNRTQELLTQPEQPEQEPVAWRWKKTSGWAYQDNSNNGGEPLYTHPLKRELMGDGNTADGFRANKMATHADSYWAGVNDAEKHHSIGGGDNGEGDL